MATNENLPPNVIKQLAKELKNLDETPPEGIKVGVDADNFSIIHADIEGPDGTPYENGVFHMKLILSNDFPHSPPKGYFLTKIFHPNIANNGEICVNALKKDWNPSLGLRHVLMVIRCLLIEPFPESALNEQAGKMLLEDYEEYARLARIYTGIHAVKSKSKSKTGGAISESKTALNHPSITATATTTTTATANIDDQKNAPGVGISVQLPSQSVLALPSNDVKVGLTHHDHSVDLTSSSAAEIGGVSAASTTTTTATGTQKKETVTKVVTEKKKIDARKKSLKRL